MIHFKGKGEHSVNELEQIILEQNEIIHNFKVKLNQKSNAFAVYPDSIKLDISSKNTLMAIFRFKEHAKYFGSKMWNRFYIIKPIYCDFLDSE